MNELQGNGNRKDGRGYHRVV